MLKLKRNTPHVELIPMSMIDAGRADFHEFFMNGDIVSNLSRSILSVNVNYWIKLKDYF